MLFAGGGIHYMWSALIFLFVFSVQSSPVDSIQSSCCHTAQSVPNSLICAIKFSQHHTVQSIVILCSPCQARQGLTPVPDQLKWGHYKMRRQWEGGKEGSSSLSSFPLHLLLLMIYSNDKTGKESVRRF